MDYQNFQTRERFPLSTQALTFMQDMILLSARVAQLGGMNYILSGCETSSGSVSDGIIVIAGEVIPFTGGIETEYIKVIEIHENITASGETYERARVSRKASFTVETEGDGVMSWDNFKSVQTLLQLETSKASVEYVNTEIGKIQTGSMPSGVIVMWGGEERDIPAGWTLCDGKTLEDGRKIPDLRGRFVVGYDSTEGSGYTKVSPGAKRPVQYNISLSTKELPAHVHSFDDYFRFDDPEQLAGVADGKKTFPASGRLRNDGETSTTMYYKTHDTRSAGSGNPFDIRPPYYVLAFIQKI